MSHGVVVLSEQVILFFLISRICDIQLLIFVGLVKFRHFGDVTLHR